MDHLSKLRNQVALRLFVALVATNLLTLACWWAIYTAFAVPGWLALIIAVVASGALAVCASLIITPSLIEPVQLIWQAILHISPDHQGTPAPNVEQARIGRELLNSLVLQVYQLASHETVGKADAQQHRESVVQASAIVSHLPLPLFVFNKQQLVTNASDTALEYCGLESPSLFGRPLFDSLHMDFPSDLTLESWIDDCQKNKLTDNAHWQRVRVRLPDEKTVRQCDIAAYYNRDNPSGAEFIVTLFDQTERYTHDDESMGFVAMAVHELRTPLTMLRGYIEVFEEELKPKLDPELTDFMHKMEASAVQLSGFVSNILNVSRIEANQLVLHLGEKNWADVLKAAVDDVQLRAQVRGKHITLQIEPNLPTIGVDPVSIYEVVNNLLENAIKYSGESTEITIAARLGKDGMVETTVTDTGLGIPQNLLPNLFEKFYRNHRTKGAVGGTGLGLYLSKAIVNAHGGQIWVESEEGRGSIFGFSLQPYSRLADEQKKGNNTDITRAAHGWVKNHSLYRR